MILSASRRTDIPAFYAEWFMNRIKEGYFYRVNPFNTKQVKKFRLSPDNIDVIVFWTKDAKKFIAYLDELDRRGYRYYFQYTLNDYPKMFEPNLDDISERIETFKRLSDKIGKDKVIWRYDPIIISNITPIEYHLEKLDKLANELSNYTNRIIISFVDLYRKVKNRMDKLKKNKGIEIQDITIYSNREKLIDFCKSIKRIALNNNLEIYSCSEEIDLTNIGIEHGKCIDANLINKLFDLYLPYKKDKNQRKECLCTEAVDLGMYNICDHRCIYCYANISDKAIIKNMAKHDVNSPILIGKYDGVVTDGDNKGKQLSMLQKYL